MITDFDTTTACFSSLLTTYKCWQNLAHNLSEAQVPIRFIHHTKDLWVRDFMPIQVRADRFVQFRYAPDYLSRLPIYRADPEPCTAPLNLPLTHSDILLDGGNVIRLANCILLSDRVLRDNPVYSPLQFVAELERLLETEVVIFPSDPYERTGHADGMVRYVGGNRLPSTITRTLIQHSSVNSAAPFPRASTSWNCTSARIVSWI